MLIIILLILKITFIKTTTTLSTATTTTTSFDSLISSQCKTKCLSLYPWNSNTNRFNRQQTEQIKWHKVMELCAKNTICLQCSLPCDIPKYLLENCKYLCKNRHSSCVESCNLLTKLNEEKYGTCSTEQVISGDDSQTRCVKDSDCEDMKKCCNNKCEIPLINQNLNLPSVPYNLTIIERKKGKTVILNWNSNYNLNKPTMFVVEGKWSLNYDHNNLNIDQQMTKWGYLAQTVNNNWIILRNIHRGRWYRFRVAAISSHGTYGYSQPTDLFILSAPPKPPSVPQNLTIISNDLINETHVDIKVAWLPPKRSDLPLTGYKIILYKILNSTKISEKSSLSELTDDDLKYENEIILNDFLKSNQINQKIIKELNTNYFYLIELFAISELTIEKQLISTPAKLLINLKSKQQHDHNYDDYYKDFDLIDDSSDVDIDIGGAAEQNIPTPPSTTTTKDIDRLSLVSINLSIRNLTLQNVYYQNGLVRARLSWMLSESQAYLDSDFQLTWFPIKCLDRNGSSIRQTQLPAPISSQTKKLQYEIYELQFSCDYVVNVKLLSSGSNNRFPTKRPIYTTIQFKVPECKQIQVIGKSKPFCYDDDDDDDTPIKFESQQIASPTTSAAASPITSSKWIYNPQYDENNVLDKFDLTNKNNQDYQFTSTQIIIQPTQSIKSASINKSHSKNRLSVNRHMNDQQHSKNQTSSSSASSSLLNYFYYKTNSNNNLASNNTANRAAHLSLLFFIINLFLCKFFC